jgi:hypothetical protein
MKLLDQPCRRHRKELAAFTAIAALTRENKIPNAISIRHFSAVFEDPGEKMVHIDQRQRDANSTVETAPLLITVEGRPHAGQIHAPPSLHEKKVVSQVGVNGDASPRQVQLPGRLDQSPAGLSLRRRRIALK